MGAGIICAYKGKPLLTVFGTHHLGGRGLCAGASGLVGVTGEGGRDGLMASVIDWVFKHVVASLTQCVTLVQLLLRGLNEVFDVCH